MCMSQVVILYSKCWLLGKCRLFFPCPSLQETGKSAEADPEIVAIVYISHWQKEKKKKKMVRNDQFPCSKKTPENSLTLYNGEEGLHFLRITVKILQELCVETRNRYMNGRNDKYGLSTNSCPIVSLRLTERFTSKGLQLLAKKR